MDETRNTEEFNQKMAGIRHWADTLIAKEKAPQYRKTSDHRLHLCEIAIKAFHRRDRIQHNVGGGKPYVWWPALAPLTPDEREVVLAELGLTKEEG